MSHAPPLLMQFPWVPVAFVLSVLGTLVSVLAVTHVLRQRRDPVVMLAWIFAILLFPGIGGAFYFLLGERNIRRRTRRRLRRVGPRPGRRPQGSALEGEIDPPGAQAAQATASDAAGSCDSHPLSELDPALRSLATFSAHLGSFPLTEGNAVEVLTSAEAIYDRIVEAVNGAAHRVVVEYYIFRADGTGERIRDALIEAARRGVQVRVLIDGIGSWSTPQRFFAPLESAGAVVRTFLPAVPLRSPNQMNCRNHRKVVVVDGSIAFTGSQNIGDEYRGVVLRHVPWKDTHLRLDGPVARHLEEIFIEDWYFACGEDLGELTACDSDPSAGRSPTPGSIVQIVPSGPDQEAPALPQIFFSALAAARESLRISTPYFVPEKTLIVALQNAAHRGVDVEILIPARTDHLLTLWAGRSYYRELIATGVSIFEFDEAMLHSKVVTIDGRWSLIGSANMDVRSFRLNFEVTATIFDRGISVELDREFDRYRKSSRRIERETVAAQSIWRQLGEGAARLFSPLL